MHPQLNSATSGINWGDVPTWIAALGTTGTLITGMYIILRGRLNSYRSQFDDLIITVILDPPTGPEEKELRLQVINNSWKSFAGVEIIGLALIQLFNDTSVLVGFKYHRGTIGSRTKSTTVPILGSIYFVDGSRPPVLTCWATDHVGRSWFKERQKRARLITWRNRFFLRRKFDRLESKVRREVGDRFTELPQNFTDTVTDV